jgi:hypothetical protein
LRLQTGGSVRQGTEGRPATRPHRRVGRCSSTPSGCRGLRETRARGPSRQNTSSQVRRQGQGGRTRVPPGEGGDRARGMRNWSRHRITAAVTRERSSR